MADYDLMTGVKKAYEAYSPTNKPTAADVGALPIAGGDLTGPLAATTRVTAKHATLPHMAWLLASGNLGEAVVGVGETDITDYIRIGRNRLQYTVPSAEYDIYHTGNKPTAADVGAATNTRHYSGDLNNLTLSGFYNLQDGALNVPPSRSGLGDQLTHHHWDNNAANQTYLAHNTKQMWFRYKAGGNWSSWTEVYHKDNVVGSGGIIERGSNANGEYVKFADGTMICTLSTSNSISTVAPRPEDVITATSRYSETWTFPSAFSPAAPTVYAAGADGVSTGIFVAGGAGTASAGLIYITKTGVSSVLATSFRRVAIGRWK